MHHCLDAQFCLCYSFPTESGILPFVYKLSFRETGWMFCVIFYYRTDATIFKLIGVSGPYFVLKIPCGFKKKKKDVTAHLADCLPLKVFVINEGFIAARGGRRPVLNDFHDIILRIVRRSITCILDHDEFYNHFSNRMLCFLF